MSLRKHIRHVLGGAIFVLLLSICGSDSSAMPAGIQANVSGIWEAHFSGTVEETGTSQTDDFVLEVQQNGSRVSGILRVQGLDAPLPLSGEVLEMKFTYSARISLGPACEAMILAETTVDAAAGRLSGSQTQSTCEGTAVGQVDAVRR